MAPKYKIDADRRYTIAIVGGGIGGLCTAIGLLHHGVPVEIYEAAPAFAEIGAGVSLGPNAIRAMRLIDPAIYEGFFRCATNNSWPDRKNFWFSFRKGQDSSNMFGTRFFDLWCGTGQSSVHRARFLDELVALVPSEIAHFGKKLEDAQDLGDQVLLTFSDGTTAKHSAVIGCDGVKSKVRQVILGQDHPAVAPTFSGKQAYRGLLNMDDAAALLGDELARNAQMYLGQGGHILTFPIEKGKTMNVVAFSTKKDGKWEDSEWVKPMDKEAMHRDFVGWIEPVQKILSMLEKPDIWALFDHPTAPTFFKGRICMLGDAAHASTPHNGAGAGMAIEDALCMSRIMRMVPRTTRQVKAARESGLLYDLQLPGYMDDIDKVAEKLALKQEWIWNHDPEAELEAAETAYREEPSKL